MKMNTKHIDDLKVQEWKATFEKYHPRLTPNRKSIHEILNILQLKYSLERDDSTRAKRVVEGNVVKNYYGTRVKKGDPLEIFVFRLKNQGNAIHLYENQSAEYQGIPIIIGAEAKSGFIFVEGSPQLADEITIIQGLDAMELENFYLVANYIRCLTEAGLLEQIIK